jgi:hypothetical protein
MAIVKAHHGGEDFCTSSDAHRGGGRDSIATTSPVRKQERLWRRRSVAQWAFV